MKYKLLIVPKSDPKADGEWVEIETVLPEKARWVELDKLLNWHIPETHYCIKVEKIK